MACSIGHRIRILRLRQRYTPRHLAELMGVSAQAVSKWENDVACPDILLLYRLSRVLKISLDDFLSPDLRL